MKRILLIALASVLPAWGTTIEPHIIPVWGYALLGSSADTFVLGGPGFLAWSGNIYGPTYAQVCPAGSPCVINAIFRSNYMSSGGHLYGIAAEALFGRVIFQGVLDVPVTPEGQEIRLTTPVTAYGQVIGGPRVVPHQLWEVTVSGQGHAEFTGRRMGARVFFSGAAYRFTGEANVMTIPEPSSLMLFAAGLPALLRLRRKRLRAPQQA